MIFSKIVLVGQTLYHVMDFSKIVLVGQVDYRLAYNAEVECSKKGN